MNLVELDVQPKSFALVVEWLYRSLWHYASTDDFEMNSEEYLQFYLLADRLGMEALKNDTLHMFKCKDDNWAVYGFSWEIIPGLLHPPGL